jgi:Ribbon-helix-helix protein, copG family
MATNLRLRPDAEEAVRAEAQRSGRSQQDIIREAVDRYLGLASRATGSTELDDLVASGVLVRPRMASRPPRRRLQLPEGVSSTELLDRADRL